ncbi:MAG: hypothetical protein ACI3VE_07575 [Oscillospiraceae bacterium]
MVKSEKLGKLMLTVGFMLAVLLLAGFMLCATASADELEPVQDTTPVDGTVAKLADVPIAAVVDELTNVPIAAVVDEMADVPVAVSADESVYVLSSEPVDEGLLALQNVEYAGANKINFRLCLHGYELLPADATVTVTAYLPVTNTVFYRSTFTKEYLALKDAVNITGGTTDGAILNLPADCVLKIEVNGANIDGWDLIYGNTVEEAIIWHPSSGFVGVAADYVPGNATYMFMSNVGGHLVHLAIDGANPDSPSGGDDGDDDNDPNGPSGGGDDNDPNGPSGGGDDDPNGPSGGGDDNGPNGPSGGGDDNDPNGPSGGDDNNPNGPSGGDEPNNPSDNSKDDNNDGGKKEPAETGDSRSIALMSVIAVISLTALAATFRKKEDN